MDIRGTDDIELRGILYVDVMQQQDAFFAAVEPFLAGAADKVRMADLRAQGRVSIASFPITVGYQLLARSREKPERRNVADVATCCNVSRQPLWIELSALRAAVLRRAERSRLADAAVAATALQLLMWRYPGHV